MPATKTRHAEPAAKPLASSSAKDETAARIFLALERLHGLPASDVELLTRAAAGMRFIRSTGVYTELEHELFRIALIELGPTESFVVESAACLATDLVPFGSARAQRSIRRADRLRAIWFAAILRIADAICTHGEAPPDDVFAAWTAEIVYLEFDGSAMTDQRLSQTRERVAALEAIAERRVWLASSTARRGVA